MSNYVIYDCDIGTDDAWGLLMLIKYEQLCKNVSRSKSSEDKEDIKKILEPFTILGVTCVQGNTDVNNCAKNAFRVLNSVDRLDIPVYKGCNEPMLPRSWQRYFHGHDGFGDIDDLPEVTNVNNQTEHAVNMMYSSVCQFPNMVDFILVGPLTNFAMCINMYGERFLDKVRHIYIMGGNYRGKGNSTKSAEFNFWMDPEAAHIVFENVKQQTITVLPWETCVDGDMDLSMDWRLNVLGKVDTKAMQLMNKVEYAIIAPKKFVKWILCDAMLVAAYCFQHLAVTQQRLYHCTVELTGTHTRGQMVLDHIRKNTENSQIIMEMHRANYKKIISWTGGLIDDVDMEKFMLAKI